MIVTDLVERRTQAENLLLELKGLRGTAMLDGQPFDSSEIQSLEAELNAVSEAEAEKIRRERAAVWDKRMKRRAELRKELAALEATRLAEIQEMNSAARTLAETIGKNISTVAGMAEVAHALSGTSVPTPLNPHANASRLSGRLAAIMGAISGSRRRFGNIEWLGASLYSPADNWRLLEEELMELHLSPLLNKEKDNVENQS